MRFMIGVALAALLQGAAGPRAGGIPATSVCSAAIVSPRNGDDVRGSGMVSGTAEIPAEGHLWVLARHQGLSGWWPQGGGEAHVADGRWQRLVFYGRAGETGPFDVAVAIVDGPADEILRQWVQSAPPDYPPTTFPNVIDGCPIPRIVVTKVGD